MRKWVGPVLTALSLLLSCGVGALWVRSYYVSELIFRPREPLNGNMRLSNTRLVLSTRGVVWFQYAEYPPLVREVEHFVYKRLGYHPTNTLPSGSFWQRRGFEYWYSGTEDRAVYRYTIVTPHWLWVLAVSPPSALWASRRLWRRRVRAGICRRCGYDLRASPDRCPECGSRITTDAR